MAQLLPKGTTARYARFDPLERVFFLTIMFLFIPIQILTGILLFDVYTMLPIIKLTFRIVYDGFPAFFLDVSFFALGVQRG